jgi:hypothetical protein
MPKKQNKQQDATEPVNQQPVEQLIDAPKAQDVPTVEPPPEASEDISTPAPALAGEPQSSAKPEIDEFIHPSVVGRVALPDGEGLTQEGMLDLMPPDPNWEGATPDLFTNEPGTAATEEDDRESPPPDADKEVAEAEKILDAKPPEEPVKPDPLAEKIKDVSAKTYMMEIGDLLEKLELVLPEHITLARKNGFPGIASDLNTLRLAGQQIHKRLNNSRYWVSK